MMPMNVHFNQGDAFICEMSTEESFKVDVATSFLPETYEGQCEVIPSASGQILNTEGKVCLSNIIIKPIPSNYGRIEWNGSTLSVI